MATDFYTTNAFPLVLMGIILSATHALPATRVAQLVQEMTSSNV
ncbi:hypothetical protein MIDIC_210006 [Alphaproteobacteria bacterium]